MEQQVIAERAKDESLRAIARDYGVSQETVRTMLVRAGHVSLLADKDRLHRLALDSPLPPPAPRKVPKEMHNEIIALCQTATQAEVAARFGVSQATVWRIRRKGMTDVSEVSD